MTESNELLNYIHKNAEMGRGTVNQLMDMVSDSKLKQQLKEQGEEYNRVSMSSEVLLQAQGESAKDPGPIAKTASYLSLNMSTMKDKSTQNIAQILINGSTTGIGEIAKQLKNHQNADENVLSLGRALLEHEQHNVEQLKKFL